MRLLFVIPALLLLAACTPPQETALTDQEQRELKAAEKFEANGNLSGAADIYRLMIARKNAPPKTYIKLSALYRKLGRGRDAVAVMREAESKDPGNTQVLSQLGYALIDADQVTDAVNTFDKLISLEPENALHYSGKGVAFDHAGNHVAAQEVYQQGLLLSPDTAAIQNNLAMSMILNQQYDEAILLLEKLVARSDAAPAMRQNLALAYGMKGERDKALAAGGRDLTPAQAQENLRFYEEYGKRTHKD